MNYLVALLLVGLTTVAFLRILSVVERRDWPSGKAKAPGAALRALLLGRRTP